MEQPRSIDGLVLRLARAEELAAVLDVERRSSVRFTDVAGREHWVDDITEMSDLEPALARNMVWVAAVDGELVGWCYASVVDDSLFIEQIDVVPEFGRRGIGGRLLDTVGDAARNRGLRALTLTTEADIPWNRPWYDKVGFRVVAAEDRPPGLAAKFAAEADRGLDTSTRVTMRRELRRDGPAVRRG